MKNMVIYSSKYGTTKKCAEKIAAHLGCDSYALETHKHIDLSNFDRIILGSSIYMGKLRKPMARFIQDTPLLLEKDIAFFICCNKTTDYMTIIPKNILNTTEISYLGYELLVSKMKGLDKWITKKVAHTTEDIFELEEEALENLIEKLSQ